MGALCNRSPKLACWRDNSIHGADKPPWLEQMEPDRWYAISGDRPDLASRRRRRVRGT
jgi:hypothetical protein